MKRTRVDETVKEGSGPSIPGSIYSQPIPNTSPSLAYSGQSSIKVVSEGMQSRLLPPSGPVSYGAMPTATAPHSGKPQGMQSILVGGGGGGHTQPRNVGAAGGGVAPISEPPQQQSPGSNFQRLKVEDALSYLDLVKFTFGSKPQVYNDFLDIMKEFKSQSIDTPGVIQRVSNLFKGFPELIVGFNTFLPPGYKIEVQRSDKGYAFQVSVSVPSPTGTLNSDPQQQKSAMILTGSGTINLSGQTNQISSQPTSQPLPLAQHIPPVAPQAPPVAPVVHHSSTYGSNAPTYNLSLSAAQAAVNHALQGHTDTPQNQPVEFNHAINYVNKIKNRFQGQPEKYKRFLEILHTYQKEQRTLKDASSIGSGGQHLTEKEVYSQVAKLFENQSDLLAEFGQFLPDATSHINQPISDHSNSVKKTQGNKPYRDHMLDRHISHKQPSHIPGPERKRSPSYPNLLQRDAPPSKKHKMSSSCRDVSISEAGKYGTLNDYAFFDKLRKAMRSPDVYNNFLRCLTLFNQEIVSKSELIQIVNPFLSKFPELQRWFREFVGQNDVETVPFNANRAERPQGDHAVEIDLTTAKRLGASYCVIPKAQEGLRCSGRTQLCKDVLNDQWVSFPTWSENSSFVSSRKTQYEEYMYRCEDERFELDVVIETNASTIRVLEGVHKKLSRMSADEVSRFKLDDTLGGQSTTQHQRALRRIYGDKAQDIIDGLKRNPSVAVPVVLRRLKAKEEEWREAQKGFNKVWREQHEKYYLKSLDHQGINFKQADVRALQSKNLFIEIATIYDARHEQSEGPHLVLPYKDRTILDDASNLLIHHLKRQTGIQKGEKRRIKQLLRQFLPDLFFHPRQQLSDDEREENDSREDTKGNGTSPGKAPATVDGDSVDIKMELDLKEEDVKLPVHAQVSDPHEAYTLFMASKNWYTFLRLHNILCERLAKIYERAVILSEEEKKSKVNQKETTAVVLRLKPKPQIDVDAFYPAFIDMVKNLLDGNMEANTYKDTLREMFGIHAYIAFTLDKVVSYAVRQLLHCVTERTALACTELFMKEQPRGAAGGACVSAHKRSHLEMGYQRAGEKAVQEENSFNQRAGDKSGEEENCFKIYIYKNDCRMTIELLDTKSEDSKKVDESKKWSLYKESYADCSNSDDSKLPSPIYLNRNLRLLKKHGILNNASKDKKKNNTMDQDDDDQQQQQRKRLQDDADQNNSAKKESDNYNNMFEELERKLNERAPPERNQTEHPGYDVSDDMQCKFNAQDTKILFTVNKDSYFYKISAFSRAKKSHQSLTKQKGARFRTWLKEWQSEHVSDSSIKQCMDWMMGRWDGTVPNRTRIITDNDITLTPYFAVNKYRVERLTNDST